MKPKKRFAQHFLTDKNIAKKIVDSLTYKIENQKINCLEIGGGKGILTQFLLQREEYDLYVVELEKAAAEYLENNFPQLKNKLIKADFLKLDLRQYFKAPLPVIGNLPYNITGPIFFKILDNRDLIPQFVCMIQKEVAQRTIAKPNSKEYGILSVMLQTFYEVEYLFTVNETVFNPPPKVKSAVIRLTRKEPPQDIDDYLKFKQVVKAAFNLRRKTLRNALKNLYLLEDVPEDFLKKRAEQLSIEDFILLAKLVK